MGLCPTPRRGCSRGPSTATPLPRMRARLRALVPRPSSTKRILLCTVPPSSSAPEGSRLFPVVLSPTPRRDCSRGPSAATPLLACARGCARLSRGHRLRNEFLDVRFLRALQLLKAPLKHDLSVLEHDEIDVDQTERVSSAAPAYAAVTVPFGPLRGDDLGCVQVVGHEHGGR